MTVNELLRDQGISHAVYLERLKTGEVRRLIELVNAVDRDLVAQISKRAGESFTKARLQSMLRDIREINDQAMMELATGLRDGLEEFAVYESRFQARRLQETIPVRWTITQPSPHQLITAVINRPFENRLLDGHLSHLSDVRFELLEGTLRMAQVEGLSIGQAVRKIRGTRALNYGDGALEPPRRYIESLVRTSLNHTATTSRERLYRENERLVKGVQIVATLDGRTTMICMSQDGKVYPVGAGPRPPFHFGCRTTTIPVIRSWRELGIDRDELPPGTRASMNGQVPETQTYAAWLKRQPAGFQRDVLGAKRYEMYRNGTPIDRFVRDGRVLSLKELERLESAAA